jgi:hypothetical protein
VRGKNQRNIPRLPERNIFIVAVFRVYESGGRGAASLGGGIRSGSLEIGRLFMVVAWGVKVQIADSKFQAPVSSFQIPGPEFTGEIAQVVTNFQSRFNWHFHCGFI